MTKRSPLGRKAPTDWEHVEKYPLSAVPTPECVPVAIGVNWYDNFDRPSAGWIGQGSLGGIRGGHCVCLLPAGVVDPPAWWTFYDQGREGACVGYGCSRMMSLLNRVRYDARWLWNEAKKVDEWPDTNPGDNNGTSVRAACDVLRAQGHERVQRGVAGTWRPSPGGPALGDGIAENRWATTVDEVLKTLGTSNDYVRVLNSWGRSYPHIVRMPAATLQRLLDEDGEACVITDRV